MTPTPDVTTADSDTLTVQQLDELEALLDAQSAGGDYVSAMRFVTDAPTAMRALLATVRRQQAALDAVTELAAVFDEREALDQRQWDSTGDRGAEGAWEIAADDLRTALASPAPTEATT